MAKYGRRYRLFGQKVPMKGLGGGFDPDYQAVLDYATTEGDTLPSAGVQDAQNTLVTDFKGYSIFSKLKELHIWRTGATGLGGFKSIDWVRLSKATLVNSPTLGINGVQGDGISAYVDLNFNAGLETTENSMTFGFYSMFGTQDGVNVSQMGGLDGANNGSVYLSRDNGSMIIAANSNLALPIGSYTNKTELQAITTDGANIELSQNGVSQKTDTITPNSANLSVYALARNSNDISVVQHSNDTLAVTFHADRLTLAELANMKLALDTYFAAL